MRRLLLCGLVVSLSVPFAAAISQASRTSAIDRPILDAHNCYPDEGRWADRLSRALGTNQDRIGIEQDLVWRRDGAGGTSVVAHSATLVGGEPTLEDHFFKSVAPKMDAALNAGNKAAWPLIVLHFDFKTNEPEHHRFVLSLLKKYERWLTTSVRGSDDAVQALTMGPLLVLTEAGENQQRDFYDPVPQGERLLLFGTVPTVPLTRSTDREVQAEAAITAAPAVLLPTGATNYRRWANFAWAIVERGGQTRAGDWTAEDMSRLTSIVSRAHELGLWVRFYTLNGVAPADSQGWSAGYNFGSLPAAQARWRAAIDAGVDLIATDQYEAAALEFSAASRRN
jgi:hypothetical protein